MGQASQSSQMFVDVTFPLVENKTSDQSFCLWVRISWINRLAETPGGGVSAKQKLKLTYQCHFGGLVQPTVGYGAGEKIMVHV